MFTGFVTVSNLSYLIARLAFDRVHDPALRDLDLTIYRAFVPGLRYEGLFPLTDSALWFHLLENAYMKLFPEIVVVLVVLHRSTSRAATSPVVALGTIALAAWRRQLSTWLAWCLFIMAYLILCPHLTATEDMALFCVLVGLERAGVAKAPLGRGGARGRRPRPEPRLWPATGDAPVPAVLYRAGEHEQPGREAA